MNPNTWYPGKPRAAQSFKRLTALELNDLHEWDTQQGAKEVALPVPGDATAIVRGRDRW